MNDTLTLTAEPRFTTAMAELATRSHGPVGLAGSSEGKTEIRSGDGACAAAYSRESMRS